MASLQCGGWTSDALKCALAPFGLTLLLFFASVTPSIAQIERTDRSHRKVIRTSEPNYPNIVKHDHIGGSVRLNGTVLASGIVTELEIVGGNANFVESATKAVLKWQYAPDHSRNQEQ